MCRKQCMKIRRVRLHGNLANYFIRTKISGKIFIFVAEGSATRAAVRASFSSPPPSLSKSMIYGESWANWRELQPPFRVLCKSRYKALSSWTKVARGSNSGVNRNRKENGNTVEGRVGNKKRGGEREGGKEEEEKIIMALEQTGNRENVVQLVETQEPIVLLNRRFASFPRVESGAE